MLFALKQRAMNLDNRISMIRLDHRLGLVKSVSVCELTVESIAGVVIEASLLGQFFFDKNSTKYTLMKDQLLVTIITKNIWWRESI